MKKYQIETSNQLDVRQLYQTLSNNGFLTTKSNGLPKQEPFNAFNRSSSQRTPKGLTDKTNTKQQSFNPFNHTINKVTSRADHNLLTKETLRHQIKEKEQQLQLQSSKSQLLNGLYANKPQNISVFENKLSLQQSTTPLELASAMQKYHQYLQNNQPKGKSLGSTQEFEGHKKNGSYSESNNKSTGISISKNSTSLLNQYVTKIEKDDISLNRLDYQSGLTKTKIKKRNQEEKFFQYSKPPTPTSHSTKNTEEQKFFSARPQTSDKLTSAQKSLSHQNLLYTTVHSKHKQKPNSVDLGKKGYSPSMSNSALIQQSSLFKRSRLISSIQGYYLQDMQVAFQKPLSEDYFHKIYRDHFYQTYQGVYFAQFLKSADPNDLKNKKVNLKRSEQHKNKICLVFDLDETLVHCNENIGIPSDVVLKIQISKNDTINAGVNIRPGAVELLRELAPYFEIIIFTASHNCYASKVLDYLDPEGKFISHRLFRDNCCMTTGGMYTKDLRIFADRSLDQLVLIDNAAYSYAWQLDNGIPIIPYYDNKQDKELWALAKYLKGMIGIKDVREYNRQHLRLYCFNEAQGPQKAYERVFGHPME